MEQGQQVTFLTTFRGNNRMTKMLEQSSQLSQLRQNIKKVYSQLPERKFINQALVNLGINNQIITTVRNVDKKQYLGFSDLKMLLNQIKQIQRQTYRLKNKDSQLQPKKNTAGYKSLNKPIEKNKQHDLERSLSKRSKVFQQGTQNDYILLKKQIQRELLYRNFVQQLKGQSYHERKQQILALKAKKANERNKKSELTHKKVNQKQKQQQINCFNKYKSMVHQDFSIWAKRSNRLSKTSHNFRDSLGQSNRQPYAIIQQPIDNENRNLKRKRKSNKLSNKQQDVSSLSNFETKETRYRNAVEKRKKFNEQKQKAAIEKVIKKNLTIESIHKKRKKQTEQEEQEMKQTMNNATGELSLGKKSSFHSQQFHLIQVQDQDEIQNEIQKKLKRKQQLLKLKSESIKISLMQKRQRFLKKKKEMQKQNEFQILLLGNESENNLVERKKKKEMCLRNEEKIQQIIRQKREIVEHKQRVRQQMDKLRKAPKQSLQKKLERFNQEIRKGTSKNLSGVAF